MGYSTSRQVLKLPNQPLQSTERSIGVFTTPTAIMKLMSFLNWSNKWLYNKVLARLASLSAFLEDLMVFAVNNAGFTRLSNIEITGEEDIFRLTRTGDSQQWWGFQPSDHSSQSYSTRCILSRLMSTAPTGANFRPSQGILDNGARTTSPTGTYEYSAPYFGYTFYSDGNNVFAVLELRQNVFTHLFFGNIRKVSSFHGGEYVTGTNAYRVFDRPIDLWFRPDNGNINTPDSWLFPAGQSTLTQHSRTIPNGTGHVRITNANGDQRDYAMLGRAETTNSGSGTPDIITAMAGVIGSGKSSLNQTGPIGQDFAHLLFTSAVNTNTLRTPLIPMYLKLQHPTEAGTVFIAGVVDNLRYVNMTNLEPRALTLTDWRVIPLGTKVGDPLQAMVSNTLGIAIREIN